MSKVILRLSGQQHRQLRDHLFPGDGKEAVAVLLCGRRHGSTRHCLSAWKVILIPHNECERSEQQVKWQTERLIPLVTEAEQRDLAVVKVHSHPTGFREFSELDGRSDRDLFSSVYGWTETDHPHASAVMLPGGEMFGRTIDANGQFSTLESISVAGDDIYYWFAGRNDRGVDEFTIRHAQAFGGGTTALLGRLSAAVIGCSGTGSPTIEQLHRLNFREIVSVDPQLMGIENLNRILNSRTSDADDGTAKVRVQQRAIEDADLGSAFVSIAADLCNPDVIKRVAECDVIFGCVDGIEARHVLNKLAVTYCIPYIDVGVRLRADGMGGIEQVSGAVHYLQPNGSSLLSRRVYTLEQYRAEALRRTDPTEFERQRGEGYIEGANEDRPAVITVNMIFSGLGVFEFLCRAHDVRDEANAGYAVQRISLNQWIFDKQDDGDRCPVINRHAGRGDMRPLLGMPEFSEHSEVVA